MELADDELQNFIVVWLAAVVSLAYTYAVARATTAGTLRLLLILPVISLFLLLPLRLTSIHLTGATAFFLSWLATFKLLLLAAGLGPLSHPSLPLPTFIALASLPIKPKPHPSPPKSQLEHKIINEPSTISLNFWLSRFYNMISELRRQGMGGLVHPHFKPKEHVRGDVLEYRTTNKSSTIGLKPQINTIPLLPYLLKATSLALFLKVYDYSDRIQPTLLWVIYFFHIYFMLDLMLAVVAAIANLFLGLELEPQFNEPLLSSSLQDFWGKRWNLMVTGILRPTVYEPVMGVCTRLVGRRKAALVAVFSTFVVSGAMHELIFYYLGRAAPTFEVSAFFVVHGACLCGEIVVKRAVGGAWRPPRVVSGMVTAVFVMGTGLWLFLPPMMRFRVDERAFEEYAAVGAFVRRAVVGSAGI